MGGARQIARARRASWPIVARHELSASPELQAEMPSIIEQCPTLTNDFADNAQTFGLDDSTNGMTRYRSFNAFFLADAELSTGTSLWVWLAFHRRYHFFKSIETSQFNGVSVCVGPEQRAKRVLVDLANALVQPDSNGNSVLWMMAHQADTALLDLVLSIPALQEVLNCYRGPVTGQKRVRFAGRTTLNIPDMTGQISIAQKKKFENRVALQIHYLQHENVKAQIEFAGSEPERSSRVPDEFQKLKDAFGRKPARKRKRSGFN